MRWNLRRGLFVIAIVVSGLLTAPPAFAADFHVTRTDDPPPNGCADGDCSLREAVIAANGSPGEDTVIVPTGT